MELIHIFSREVEYSEENLEDLAEEFLFDDIFEKEQLCALLKGWQMKLTAYNLF